MNHIPNTFKYSVLVSHGWQHDFISKGPEDITNIYLKYLLFMYYWLDLIDMIVFYNGI